MFPFHGSCEYVYHVIYDGDDANFTTSIVSPSCCHTKRVVGVSFDQVKAAFESILPFISRIDAVVLDYSNCHTAFPLLVHHALCEWLQTVLDEGMRIVVAPIHVALFRDIRQIDYSIRNGEQLVLVSWRGKSSPLKDFVLIAKEEGVFKPLKVVEKSELDSIDFNTLIVSFDTTVSQRGLARIQKMFPEKNVVGVEHTPGALTEPMFREYFFNRRPRKLVIEPYRGIIVTVKVGSKQLVIDNNFANVYDNQQYMRLDAGVTFFEVFVKYFSYADDQPFAIYQIAALQKPRLLVLRFEIDKFLIPRIEYEIVDIVMSEERLPSYIEPASKQNYLMATTLMSIHAPVVNCILDNPYSVVHHAIYPNVESLIKPYETNEDLIIDLMARTPPSVVKLCVQEYYDSSTIAVINERRETLKLAGYTNVKLMHSFALTWTCILRSMDETIAVGETVAILGMIRTVVLKRCKYDFEVVQYYWVVDNYGVLPCAVPQVVPDHVILDNTRGEYDHLPHAKKKNVAMAQKECMQHLCSYFWSLANHQHFDGYFIRDFADVTFYVMSKNGLDQCFSTKLVSLPFEFRVEVKFRVVDEVEIRVGNNINQYNERYLVEKIKVKQHPLAVFASLNLTLSITAPCEFKVHINSTSWFLKETDFDSLSDEDKANSTVCTIEDILPPSPPPPKPSVGQAFVPAIMKELFLRGTLAKHEDGHSRAPMFRNHPPIRSNMPMTTMPSNSRPSANVVIVFTTTNLLHIQTTFLDYSGQSTIAAYVSFKDGIHVGQQAVRDCVKFPQYIVYDVYKLVADEKCTVDPKWPFTVTFNDVGVTKVTTGNNIHTDPLALFDIVLSQTLIYIKTHTKYPISTIAVQLPKRSSTVRDYVPILGERLGIGIFLLH